LSGADDVDIIIVDDGSTDATAAIADEYAARYPEWIRAIHQENRGHGGAISAGIEHAQGAFVKVVDSDDWVDVPSYKKILATLRSFPETGRPDVMVNNYVYEKETKRHKTVVRYVHILPQNRLFTWDQVGRFPKGKYILMHSLIYRTAILRDCGLSLPLHTFYVDNLYAYIPLRHTKKLYYLNVDFYRYYIGRAGQSVEEQTMIRNIDQQLFVNRLMISSLALDSIREKRKRQYLFNYLEIVTMASSAMLLRAGTEEHLRKKQELWEYIRGNNRRLYHKLRYGVPGSLVHLPGATGRNISISVYKLSRKMVGFN
jgi:glycosyltransferase involved in cell wall biosynthesis